MGANDDSASMSNGEEIAGMLMQVTEKADRCWDFDLQHWLTLYHAVRMRNVNFPEAAMLVSCAAQIYGRKVDYLNDIVVHMNDDQKARETKTQEEEKLKAGEEVGVQGETSSKTPGRKRAGRFNPQSLSDCFGDLEFSCNDKKLLKLESLIQTVPTVDVDRRTMVQQMQELCMELRANPSRQRKQEILNRLRDDACIAPIMSSNGASRKNQIADLESGEAIGTRYDYQIHQNYIDGRTGSLIAEHDLKRFFQRCDVIDFLFEQHQSNGVKSTKLDVQAPVDRLWQGERGIKLYMPPEYLDKRYRIKLNDTSDFDNALIQARVTNYNSDPILSLMDHALRAKKIAAESLGLNDSTVLNNTTDSGFGDSTVLEESPSLNDVLSSTRTDDSESDVTRTLQESTLETSQELSIESGRQDDSLAKGADSSMKQNSTEKSIAAASRLSVDEGIGVDCEAASPRSTLVNLVEENIIKPKLVIFTPGTVFPRAPTVLRPVKLVQNILGIPEDMARKQVQFALPMEYRKLKTEFVKRHERERDNVKSCVQLHSLKPTANSTRRPSIPDQEQDFLGFADEPGPQTPVKVSNRKTKSASSSESSPVKQKRSSTTEQNFEGFDEGEILAARKVVEQLAKRFLEKPKHPCSPSKRTNGSLPGTPTRTLSCDSGISDTVDRTVGQQPCIANSMLDSIEEHADNSDCDLPAVDEEATDAVPHHQAPSQRHTDECNARIEEKMNEAKERFDKVSEWHRNLKPILMESEKRTHFDIHAYGSDIIDTFDPAVPLGSEVITLEKVLENKPAHSTARFFLSVLMLANTSNIEISNRNADSHRLSKTGEIDLRLLSRKRHHKELEALGELLPSTAADDVAAKERVRDKRQNRKRKHLQLEQDALVQQQGETSGPPITRADPSNRIGGLNEGLDGCDDGDSFFDNVHQVYAELNSERAQHKRLAFRRGMRNCAYGLTDLQKEPETPARTKGTPSVSKAPPDSVQRTICPSLILSDPDEDLLTIDLLTNQATLVPAAVRAADTSCAKSVFSMAESGYESMLSVGGDDV